MSLNSNNMQAISWQIKFLLNGANSKKTCKAALKEIQAISECSGQNFDELLLKIPLELLDVKDLKNQNPNKENSKINFFMEQFKRLNKDDRFAIYIPNIIEALEITNVSDFHSNLTKLFKFSIFDQLIMAIAIAHTSNPNHINEGQKLLKTKLKEYFENGKPLPLPDYASHFVLNAIHTWPLCKDDLEFQKSVSPLMKDSNTIKENPRNWIFSKLDIPNIKDKEKDKEDKNEKYYKEVQIKHELTLWEVLCDIDSCISSNYQTLFEVLQEISNVNDSEIADTLVHFANHHSSDELENNRIALIVHHCSVKGQWKKIETDFTDKKFQNLWNLDNLAKALNDLYRNIKWEEVPEHLDKKENLLKDQKAFVSFFVLYNKCKPSKVKFPCSLLYKRWKNIDCQIQFLESSIVTFDPNLFIFENCKKQDIIESFQGIKSNVIPYLSIWCCIDLVQILIELSDSKYYQRIRSLFEYPLKNCPEYLLVVLAQISPNGGQFLLEELFSLLIPMFLVNHPNSIPVIEKLWSINRQFVLKAIINTYRYDPNLLSLSRILDITQEIKDLCLSLISTTDYDFIVPCGILAGKRDFLFFEKWLTERIKQGGDDFVKCLLQYLDDNIIAKSKEKDYTKEKSDRLLDKSQLSLEKLTMIYENLIPEKVIEEKKISAPMHQRVKENYAEMVKIFHSLIANSNNQEEIEKETNRNLEKVFQGDMQISEFIEIMKNYRNSKEKKQNEIYSCILHNLLDEMKYIHQFPDKELKIFGELFGAIIGQKVIQSIPEKIAIKYIFEAIKKEESQKYFSFGIHAIEKFLDRIHEFKGAFELLINNNKIKDELPEFYNKIKILYNKHKDTNSNSQQSQPQTNNTPSEPPPALSFHNENQTFAAPSVQKPSFHPYIPEQNTKQTMLAHAQPFLPQPHSVNPQQNYYNNPSARPFQQLNYTSITPQPSYPILSRDIPPPMTGMAMNSVMRPNYMMGGEYPIMMNPDMSYFNRGGSVQGQALIDPNPSKFQSLNFLKFEKDQDIKNAEKLRFIINNISEETKEEKAKEVKHYFEDRNTIKWFANFLVNRISNEQNQIKLYVSFVELIKNRNLSSILLEESLDAIKRLMNAASSNNNIDQLKNPAKNYGTLLGDLTLAKNKIISTRHLDLKQLIKVSYSGKYLIASVPFFISFLKEGFNSKIFTIRNPWMKQMICLILELQNTQQVTSNFILKYEIKMFFQFLSENKVDSSHLKSTSLLDTQESKNLPFESTPIIPAPVPKENLNSGSGPNPILIIPSPFHKASPNPDMPKRPLSHDANWQKEIVHQALTDAINDVLDPVVTRSLMIAIQAAKALVCKDFEDDNDEEEFIKAAAFIAKGLAGSLAAVTCKEPLKTNLTKILKDTFTKFLPEASGKYIDQIININSKDQLDYGCTFIENEVMQRAVAKVFDDTDLLKAYEQKKNIRKKGGKKDENERPSSPKHIPKGIERLSGKPTDKSKIYSNFGKILAKNCSGFINEPCTIDVNNPKFSILVKLIKQQIEIIENSLPKAVEQGNNHLSLLIEELKKIDDLNLGGYIIVWLINCCNNSNITFPEKVQIYIDTISKLLNAIPAFKKVTTAKLIEKNITRLCLDIIIRLFKAKVIEESTFDYEMSRFIQNLGASHLTSAPIHYCSNLLKSLITKEKLYSISQFPNLTTSIEFCGNLMHPKEVYQKYMSKCISLFQEWNVYGQKDQLVFYEKLTNAQIFATEEQVTGFVAAIVEEVIQNYSNEIGEGNTLIKRPEGRQNFKVIDNLAELFEYILVSTITSETKKNPSTDLKMANQNLQWILKGIINAFIIQNQNPLNLKSINQIPFLKIFFNLISSLSKPSIFNFLGVDPFVQIGKTLEKLCPLKFPFFVFGWVELISNPKFLKYILIYQESQNAESNFTRWEVLKTLLIHLFDFMRVIIVNGESHKESSKKLYTGILRLFLLILHDFPDFLDCFHFELVASIPDQLIQIRNLILSSAPLNMKVTDPYSTAAFEESNEMKELPKYIPKSKEKLKQLSLINDLERYYKLPSENILLDICNKLMSIQDIRQKNLVIYSLVLFLAEQAQLSKNYNFQTTAEMIIKICDKADSITKENLFNSMANELRYPNSYTYYFSNLLLTIFKETKNSFYQEQIARVLIERMLTHNPIPWGLIRSLIELFENPEYDFKNKPFTRCTPEVENFFKQIFNSRKYVMEIHHKNESETS